MAYYDPDLRVKFQAPLHKDDTSEQTHGCRATNPELCSYVFVEKKCAFCRADGICKHPSRAWKSQFSKLHIQK